jgi:hypothetical protein|tara:strand:- start:18 stop:224 length:207 start_codon:yes stop_codon:yes gene_type:complete
MKIIWYIIDKFNARFRKPLVCGYYIVNNPKPFINKLTLKEEDEEQSQNNTWAIIILAIFVLKMVKGIL